MRFGGIVLATALVLGACSSDPTPKEPDPSKPTTATTTPAVALPTMPPQASEDSPEGAAAFVKHYVDVFNYAAATGDVKELSRLSAPDCEGCQSYINLYQDTYKAGGYFKGGDWTIGELQVRVQPNETYLTTTMTATPSLYLEPGSKDEKKDPGERTTISFAASRRSIAGSWSMTQLGLGEVE